MGGVQSLVLQAWSPAGSQVVDQGTDLPGGFGPVHPGSLSADLGGPGHGLQGCAGAAYPVFTVQGLRKSVCKRPPLLWRIL